MRLCVPSRRPGREDPRTLTKAMVRAGEFLPPPAAGRCSLRLGLRRAGAADAGLTVWPPGRQTTGAQAGARATRLATPCARTRPTADERHGPAGAADAHITVATGQTDHRRLTTDQRRPQAPRRRTSQPLIPPNLGDHKGRKFSHLLVAKPRGGRTRCLLVADHNLHPCRPSP